MALTIAIDGYGVVADADGLTDGQGGTWRELGGGTIAFNPDVYLYEDAGGAGSIGSKYANKTGYTYVDGITALDFLTALANAEDNFIYLLVNIQSKGAFATLATNGLAAMIGSATGDSREWKIAGSDDANGWTGGWKCFVIDPQIIAGTVLNGTPDMTAVDTIGIWIDTDVSVRADSIFISQINCGKGVTCTGSPTVTGGAMDELVDWCTDYANRAFGALEKRGSTAFQKGGITVGDGTTATTFSAYGNNIECEESSFWNGSAWVSSYPSTANFIKTLANAALDLQDVNWSGFADNKLEIDTSVGNASSVKGGVLKLLRALSIKASDTFNGVVFTENDALTLSVGTFTACTFNNVQPMTMTGATIAGGTVKNNASSSGALVISAPAQMNALSNISFEDNNRCIEITTAGDYTFNGHQFGTNTIQVNFSGTGTCNITPSNGCNVVQGNCEATGGGTINVNATAYNFTINVNPTPSPNYEWRIYTVDAKGSMTGAVEIDGAESATGASFLISHTYTSQAVAVQIISDDYEEFLQYYTLEQATQTQDANLELDTND